jgi:hypothetical protein
MTALGQTRTSERFRFMSAQVPQAEIQATQYDVAVVPTADFGEAPQQGGKATQNVASKCQPSWSHYCRQFRVSRIELKEEEVSRDFQRTHAKDESTFIVCFSGSERPGTGLYQYILNGHSR